MLPAAAALLLLVGFVLAIAAIVSLAGGRLLRFLFRSAFALVLLAIGGALGVVVLGMQGLQALTHEETAARIKVIPTSPQRFEATFRFADGRTESYDLAGDEILVDAHIIKWTPFANRLGLHTSYRLDRIAGRYRSVIQENTARRTVHALTPPPWIDLVALRQRLPLDELFDAEYGSATYVPVVRPDEIELKVSTSGLLLRPAGAAPK